MLKLMGKKIFTIFVYLNLWIRLLKIVGTILALSDVVSARERLLLNQQHHASADCITIQIWKLLDKSKNFKMKLQRVC